ncbi:iron complex outermembrane receptor protein [Sphingomonas zeicaulis]|uniref:TonB-dependent receptor n=1 Tax=Sphingomonas zeicaulis TaxID=1632740 RepID=UPI003D1B1D1A
MKPAYFLFTASFVVTAGLPSAAIANEADAAPDAAAEAAPAPDVGGDIIVQAQRRAEKASDVPLALSVVKGDDILRYDQLRTTNDVLQFVPNAQAAQPHGPSRARWFVRGIGTNNTGSNTINPLGIYYDDVYISDISNQGYPLFDLDRVEVLNGPQGTLWGKNSNAGAINFVSRAPSFDADGYAQVEYGSFDEKRLEAAIGGPLLGDKIAGRVAFYYNDWDGWQNNRFTGKHHPGATEVATRVQLLLKPTETLSILFNAHSRDYSGPQQGTNYVASTVTTNSTQAWRSVYPNGFPTGGWRDTYAADLKPEKLEARGANAKINWDGDFATITSITAYEQNKLSQESGGVAIPENSRFYSNGGPFSQSNTEGESWQVSEELRIASPSEQRFTWLGGLYAFKGALENRAVVASYVRGDPGSATATSNAWGTGPQFTDTWYKHRIENLAFFANVGFKVSDAFRISGGARWSTEKSSFDWQYGAANIVGNAATFIPNLPQINIDDYGPRDLIYTERATQKTNAWTYDVTPEYIFSQQARVYFRFAHGVLPGGYTSTGNVTIPSTSSGSVSLPLAATGARPATLRANQIFVLNPEKIDAYELGLKTAWFGRRLTVDLAAFYYDYTNLVVNVPTQIDPLPANATVLFRNAGAAEIKGVELRFNAAPVKGLSVAGSFGYLDSEYVEDFGETDTILGARPPRTSKYTANLTASYTHGIGGGGGSLTYSVDANWRSKFYFYPTIASQITNPDPLLAQGDYALANARIGWSVTDDDRLSFAVSVQNLTNTKYKTHSLPVSSGFSNQIYGRPRSFLVSANARF